MKKIMVTVAPETNTTAVPSETTLPLPAVMVNPSSTTGELTDGA